MSEYECGHEIFDYNEDGTYIKECHLCKPEPMTLQQQLAEMHKGKTIPVNSPMGTYFEYCVDCSKIKAGQNPCMDQRGLVDITDCPVQPLKRTLQAILDIEKKRLSGSHDTFTAGRVAGYNSALATVAEVAGEGMRG